MPISLRRRRTVLPRQLTMFSIERTPKHASMNYFSGMSYKDDDGVTRRYETKPKGRTTIELMREGVRTMTTRRNENWNVGDIIIFKDKGNYRDFKGNKSRTAGESMTIEIIRIVETNEKDFKAYEGWTDELWDNKKNQLEGQLSYIFNILKYY